MEDLKSWLALAQAPELHAGHIAGFLEQGRSPTELLAVSPATCAALGVREAALASLHRPDPERIDADIAWLEGRPHRRVVAWGSPDYPPLLALIPDAPLVLYVEGDPAALSLPQLAIVGSRNPTSLGRDTARQFGMHLARAGLAITSGLALGIDAAAHRGALDADGSTIAVVGRGLDAIYPRDNEELARCIVERHGALVTDLPVGTPPLKQNFPRRNRILSGLAAGTLVVEAALQSGSLITARLAGEQGREVFAMPGSIHNALARGCHKLLRQGAKLVETADDIFAELAPILGQVAASVPPGTHFQADSNRGSLDKDYEILLDALGFEPANLDSIVVRSGLKADAVASMLLILELDGRIQQQPGGRYSRTLPGKV